MYIQYTYTVPIPCMVQKHNLFQRDDDNSRKPTCYSQSWRQVNLCKQQWRRHLFKRFLKTAAIEKSISWETSGHAWFDFSDCWKNLKRMCAARRWPQVHHLWRPPRPLFSTWGRKSWLYQVVQTEPEPKTSENHWRSCFVHVLPAEASPTTLHIIIIYKYTSPQARLEAVKSKPEVDAQKLLCPWTSSPGHSRAKQTASPTAQGKIWKQHWKNLHGRV